MRDDIIAGRCVLVVEDDYLLAVEMDQALKAVGATVLGPVPSVQAALDVLGEKTPDAAALDVNLDGETSFTVADTLAADGVPFIFVTGYDHAAIPTCHVTVRWLAKPVQTSDALRAIGRLFGAAG